VPATKTAAAKRYFMFSPISGRQDGAGAKLNTES
jgi:hypothetical protein